MDYAATLREITQPKGKVPVIKPGQTVRVYAKIVEGDKERIQAFEGLVIGVKGSGVNKTFTVRKVASGVGVERTWPVFSPRIEKIEVIKQSKVRRAKLNFVRGLTKKQSRLKDRFGEVMMEGTEHVADDSSQMSDDTAKEDNGDDGSRSETEVEKAKEPTVEGAESKAPEVTEESAAEAPEDKEGTEGKPVESGSESKKDTPVVEVVDNKEGEGAAETEKKTEEVEEESKQDKKEEDNSEPQESDSAEATPDKEEEKSSDEQIEAAGGTEERKEDSGKENN